MLEVIVDIPGVEDYDVSITKWISLIVGTIPP
jgi:hypothetical protein